MLIKIRVLGSIFGGQALFDDKRKVHYHNMNDSSLRREKTNKKLVNFLRVQIDDTRVNKEKTI